MSTQWKTGSGSFNGLSVESAQFILDIGKFCNWISFFLADGQHLSFWHTCFWLFEFKISDIWQQLSYRTKLRTTGLMALPFIANGVRPLLSQNVKQGRSNISIRSAPILPFSTNTILPQLSLLLCKFNNNTKSLRIFSTTIVLFLLAALQWYPS